MRLKSKGFLLIEAIIIICIVGILSLSISKFAINISYLTYEMHYQSKASVLVSNFISILKLPNFNDKHNLIEKFKKQVALYLPNGRAIISNDNVQIYWLNHKKENQYTFKFHNKGFVLIESLGYLFIINLVILGSLSVFYYLNNVYQLQAKLFSVDDSFILAKSYIENDLKNNIEVKILSDNNMLHIKKYIEGRELGVYYFVKQNSNKQLGLFRSENLMRSEEVVPYIASASYSLLGISKLINIRLYAKVDNINDSIEIMLKL